MDTDSFFSNKCSSDGKELYLCWESDSNCQPPSNINRLCYLWSHQELDEEKKKGDIWWITCIPTPSESFGVSSGIPVQLK